MPFFPPNQYIAAARSATAPPLPPPSKRRRHTRGEVDGGDGGDGGGGAGDGGGGGAAAHDESRRHNRLAPAARRPARRRALGNPLSANTPLAVRPRRRPVRRHPLPGRRRAGGRNHQAGPPQVHRRRVDQRRRPRPQCAVLGPGRRRLDRAAHRDDQGAQGGQRAPVARPGIDRPACRLEPRLPVRLALHEQLRLQLARAQRRGLGHQDEPGAHVLVPRERPVRQRRQGLGPRPDVARPLAREVVRREVQQGRERDVRDELRQRLPGGDEVRLLGLPVQRADGREHPPRRLHHRRDRRVRQLVARRRVDQQGADQGAPPDGDHHRLPQRRPGGRRPEGLAPGQRDGLRDRRRGRQHGGGAVVRVVRRLQLGGARVDERAGGVRPDARGRLLRARAVPGRSHVRQRDAPRRQRARRRRGVAGRAGQGEDGRRLPLPGLIRPRDWQRPRGRRRAVRRHPLPELADPEGRAHQERGAHAHHRRVVQQARGVRRRHARPDAVPPLQRVDDGDDQDAQGRARARVARPRVDRPAGDRQPRLLARPGRRQHRLRLLHQLRLRRHLAVGADQAVHRGQHRLGQDDVRLLREGGRHQRQDDLRSGDAGGELGLPAGPVAHVPVQLVPLHGGRQAADPPQGVHGRGHDEGGQVGARRRAHAALRWLVPVDHCARAVHDRLLGGSPGGRRRLGVQAGQRARPHHRRPPASRRHAGAARVRVVRRHELERALLDLGPPGVWPDDGRELLPAAAAEAGRPALLPERPGHVLHHGARQGRQGRRRGGAP